MGIFRSAYSWGGAGIIDFKRSFHNTLENHQQAKSIRLPDLHAMEMRVPDRY